MKHIKSFKLLSPIELLDIKDKVGDTEPIEFAVDLGNRDEAFVYLDGDLLFGEGKSHTQIVNDYCEDHDLNNLSKDFERVDEKEVADVTNREQVAFGHIVEGMAFIETLFNVSLEEVLDAVKKYKKVYELVDYSHVTRLAKINNNKKVHSKLYKKLNKLADVYDDYENKEEEKELIDDPYEFSDLDDSVGDKIPVESNFTVDYPHRDGPILIIDGEIFVGNSEETHAMLINEWLDAHPEEFTDEEENEETGEYEEITYTTERPNLEDNWWRPQEEEIQEKTDDAAVIFGSAVDDVAFLDSAVNCSVEDGIPIAKKEFKKVYIYYPGNEEANRVASKNNSKIHKKRLYKLVK